MSVRQCFRLDNEAMETARKKTALEIKGFTTISENLKDALLTAGRTRSDPVPAWPRFNSDDGAIPRVQAAFLEQA
jgi:hypothetical protein